VSRRILPRVVQRKTTAGLVAVIENCTCAGGFNLGEERVRNRLRVVAIWFSKDAANPIEVVDRRNQHLDARLRFEKRKHLPRLEIVQMHIYIDDWAKQIAPNDVTQRQHHRAKAKLEI